jgi:dTDP-4-dehydrorhamnose reductase
MKRLVLVLGARGQLGEAITASLQDVHEVVGWGRADLDLGDPQATASRVAALGPDVVINCAAYNNVDGAQSDPEAALAINAWAVRTLARTAHELDATFVHYSTDFVFDGDADRPYREDDEPNPRGTYAVSKLLGEWFAEEVPRHFVLRVESLFGGARARSSVDRMLTAILSGQEVRAFADRTVSPSFVDDVVTATLALVDGARPWGLYHCVNTGWTTWAALARELAMLSERSEARITDVAMSDAGLAAPRPQFAALSNAKLAMHGIEMPTWQDALARYVARVRSEQNW